MIDCKDLLLKGRGDFYSLIKTESTWKTVSHYPVQTLDVRFYLFNSHLFQFADKGKTFFPNLATLNRSNYYT